MRLLTSALECDIVIGSDTILTAQIGMDERSMDANELTGS